MYATNRRPTEPPVYNEARVNEQPLPNILPPILEQMPNVSMIEPLNNDQSIDNLFADDEHDEPLMMVPTTSDLSDAPIDPLALVIKEELEPLHTEDIQAVVEELLHEESQFEQFGDGLFISVEGEMPLPMIGMNTHLKKDDVLSGKLLFIEHVSKYASYWNVSIK